MSDVTCIGWNIRHARGADGVADPVRTARTFRGEVRVIRPDVLVLQVCSG
ncbi:hypothetical protein [Roseivivax halodurans]|nr:hypothetical protein [Roseivivax halodurans]